MDITNAFVCTQCGALCDTAHELNDHMQSHAEAVDTYANKAKSPPTVGFSASQPTTSTHVQPTHDETNRKRGASVSPNSGNTHRRKTQWTKISNSNTFFQL